MKVWNVLHPTKTRITLRPTPNFPLLHLPPPIVRIIEQSNYLL